MANENKSAATATPAFDDKAGEGLFNLAQRFPVYDGGDARVDKPGTRGKPIHGHLLGRVKLPGTIKDKDTGEFKPWNGIIIELLQPAPVVEKHGDEEKSRIALKGERIILTETKALESYAKIADHPTKVWEAFIVPVVSKTQAGQSLWIYPEFKVGRPLPRTERHLVGVSSMFDEGQTAPKALTEGARAQA